VQRRHRPGCLAGQPSAGRLPGRAPRHPRTAVGPGAGLGRRPWRAGGRCAWRPRRCHDRLCLGGAGAAAAAQAGSFALPAALATEGAGRPGCQALDVLRRNVALNSLETSASVTHLDWERPDACALSGQAFDLVLACDVLYASKLAPVRFSACALMQGPLQCLLLTAWAHRASWRQSSTFWHRRASSCSLTSCGARCAAAARLLRDRRRHTAPQLSGLRRYCWTPRRAGRGWRTRMCPLSPSATWRAARAST
jgi:hypothetical protein